MNKLYKIVIQPAIHKTPRFSQKLLLLLFLVLAAPAGMAQTKSAAPKKSKTTQAVKKTAPKAAKITVTAKASTPVQAAPAARLIWRSNGVQQALALYTALKFPEAYAGFKAAARQGDSDALYFLGRMHQYRQLKYEDVKIDTLQEVQNAEKYFAANRDSAAYYYKAAVDSGSVLGHLGLAELMTLRTEDDKTVFLQHMRTAAIEIREKAVAGDAFCNRILGSMYYTGFGEMKDMGLALNYLNRAAQKNDVVAYTYLANMYLDGKGVPQDKEKATALLKKGAAAGDREALYTLALLHEEGTLGEVNIPEARKLYRAAVSKGSVSAYEQLRYINQTPDQKVVIAAINRDPDMLKRAIAAGGDVNTMAEPDDYEANLHGRTPLMHTVYIPMLLEDYGVTYQPEVRLTTASQLLKKGADVNAQDLDGKTALHYVVSCSRIQTEFFEQEQVQLLDTLFRYGADPNLQDKEGNTALAQALHATIGQHIGILELQKLLDSGANPNIQNNEGKTPLMLACEIDANYEIILALLQSGTDATLKDSSGKAAIDYTKHENVRNILLAAGSPQPQP
ncbi:ankyrin repeat domain-containing protein [Pontibacter sp. 172403-2]|uniref:ankyrin repeat domain-containing protein n=1 Tax=Pontibacter rufus TaxID=2791028 RepID=UPI0018AF8515|nr:ankyrin repeat domain-containing protein [Pontibacter sp. 172403-2]MBF9254647.1 ankyrin repeat domain-containing protein [Pontibacter sp. 172403-2]